jgi:hypothetical protein
MATTLKIRIEVPAEADEAVVEALRVAALALDDATIEEVAEAPPNSYSLTVHVFPDPEKE